MNYKKISQTLLDLGYIDRRRDLACRCQGLRQLFCPRGDDGRDAHGGRRTAGASASFQEENSRQSRAPQERNCGGEGDAHRCRQSAGCGRRQRGDSQYRRFRLRALGRRHLPDAGGCVET